MFKLGSKVLIKTRDVDARVFVVSKFLSGYTKYAVEFWKQDGINGKELFSTEYHEPELELVNEDDVVELTTPDPSLALGTPVMIKFSDIGGVITAHSFSLSGCVEYEVTHFVPGVGIQRKLFEAELLIPYPPQVKKKIPQGEQTGSMSRGFSSR